jgi:hypothetical protein
VRDTMGTHVSYALCTTKEVNNIVEVNAHCKTIWSSIQLHRALATTFQQLHGGEDPKQSKTSVGIMRTE